MTTLKERTGYDSVDQLCREYYPLVGRFLGSMGLQRDVCEDLTQTTFLKVISNIDRYQRGNLRGWVLTIARNAALSYFRKKREIPFPNLESRFTGAGYSEPESAVIAAADLQKLPKVINGHLPEHYLKPFLLMRCEGYEQKEVAEKLGIPLGTAQNRTHRAKQIIMKYKNQFI